MNREILDLSNVTACAVASVNVHATIEALGRCIEQARFAEVLLFTDAQVTPQSAAIRVVPIERIGSIGDYSRFMLSELPRHLSSEHCLVVQWDGFIVDSNGWDPRFLDYDYIGAPWPQYGDGWDVGNGGFSLRSRRLMARCAELPLIEGQPEDVFICRDHRGMLEAQGIRYAPRDLAARFSHERGPRNGSSFGFHGVFNMVDMIGADAFWSIYRQLDSRAAVYFDAPAIGRALRHGRNGFRRRIRLTWDSLPYRLRRRLKLLSGRLVR